MPERYSTTDLADRIRRAGRDPEVVMRSCPPQALHCLRNGQPVRTGLARVVAEKPCVVEERDGEEGVRGDGLTIEGHWTVFDSPTEINSWEGNFTERVLPGATRKTLREATPKMQFDHGHHPLLGSLPLGRWTEAKETERGSWSQGRMSSNWLTQPFAEAVRDGLVDGMSFRFSVVKERWYDAQDKQIRDEGELFDLLFFGAGDRGPLRRDLVEVNVAEAGPVVWPAYKDTNVGARSSDGARMVIDLAALGRGDRREAGYLVAALDAELARAAAAYPGTPAGDDPRARWQPVGASALAELARSATPLDAPEVVSVGAQSGADVHNPAVATRSAVIDEPPTTGAAAEHSVEGSEPRSTGQPAGEHSQSGQDTQRTRPANPTERRKTIREEYREVLQRDLALPPSP